MNCGSRRIIAAGRPGRLVGIRRKLASTPMPGACSTIRRSTRPIVSSMAGMIPVFAPDTLALGPNGCSDIPRRRWPASADALALAERIAHPFTLGLALHDSSVVYLNRREPGRALRQLEAAEVLATEQRLFLIHEPGMLHGAALLGQGAVEEAIARIREGVEKWTRLGRALLCLMGSRSSPRVWRGTAIGRRHWPRCGEGLETAGATGEVVWDAELHRVTGTVLLAENKLDEAQASFQQAIRIAQAQQAKSLELRAATSLARLWGEQGRRSEARELLAPIYRWFTEGFDTVDLKEAKALLDELA